MDVSFVRVLQSCAEAAPKLRLNSWINHSRAHSVPAVLLCHGKSAPRLRLIVLRRHEAPHLAINANASRTASHPVCAHR